jgi:16S rRNA A1518/A1519 N6-dimethyltransferase RsmA/KsgA/DIM1 with predicted DNA glycosylase/AP lyase activity
VGYSPFVLLLIAISVIIKNKMAFADPIVNLRQVNLMPGMTVVDFGAGSGAYTLPAAELVAPTGKVYAVEIQKDLLETIIIIRPLCFRILLASRARVYMDLA